MDKFDLIVAAIKDAKDDNSQRCDRLEQLVNDKFDKLNGRVRKNELEITKIKTLWSGATVVFGAIWHYLVG